MIKNIKINKILNQLHKYNIWILFLYFLFCFGILLDVILSVINSKNTTLILNAGFIILDIFAIIFLLIYIISNLYKNKIDFVYSWKFYLCLYLLTINLIVLPILVHFLKTQYVNNTINNMLNFDVSLSITLWMSLIFIFNNFICSIILFIISYKQIYPFNNQIVIKESQNESVDN